ncbi:MAG: zinc-dependent metalloprotease [Saprospiraceae bacterium]|nr:zinc-dependent metalloprotease [Saprospiraceae bacterium]
MFTTTRMRPMVARHFLALVLLFSGLMAHAQSDILTLAPGGADYLVGDQLDRYNKIVALDEDIIGVDVIELGNLALIQDDGRIKVTLPDGAAVPLIFQMQNIAYDSDNQYTWYGEVDHTDTSEWRSGSMMLIAENGEKYGYIHVEERFYTIQDLTGGKYALVRLKEDAAETCGNDDAGLRPDVLEEASAPTVQDREERCPIRILVMFTDAARTRFPNIAAMANTALAQTRQAFLNSGLGTVTISLITAGIENLPEYTEANKSFNTVIGEISNNATVIARRNALGADLVSVIVDRQIMTDPTVGGVAFLGAGNAAFGFSVVAAQRVTSPGFVMAHEIGHNLAANHEPCTAQDPGVGCIAGGGSVARAHTWSFTRKCGFLGWGRCTVRRRTIMYSEGANNTDVIQHYSNPAVNFEGRPTGIAGARNNASIIAGNACTVAGYRTTNEAPLWAIIYGPDEVCEGFEYEYFWADAGGGPPGQYTYAWQVAIPGTGGTSFGPVLSTNSFFELDLTGLVAGQYVTIKLTVTKGGQSVTTYHTVYIIDPGNLLCFRSENSDEDDVKKQLTEVGAAIYPNPNDGAMTVELLTDAGTRGRVSILNHLGQEVFVVYDGMFETWKTTFNTKMSHLSNGLYFLSVNTPEGRKTVRFVISK